MQLLRESVIGILNSSSPNYDAAREVIGQYLHMLQMFYSNTNWVEMNGNKIHEPLGEYIYSFFSSPEPKAHW